LAAFRLSTEDTGWLEHAPELLIGGQRYAVFNKRLENVENRYAGIEQRVGKIETRLAIEEHAEGHESVTIVEITPTPLPTTPEKQVP